MAESKSRRLSSATSLKSIEKRRLLPRYLLRRQGSLLIERNGLPELRVTAEFNDIGEDGFSCHVQEILDMAIQEQLKVTVQAGAIKFTTVAAVCSCQHATTDGTRLGFRFLVPLVDDFKNALRSLPLVKDRRGVKDRRDGRSRQNGNAEKLRQFDRRGQWGGYLGKRFFSQHALDLQSAGVYFYMKPIQSASGAHVTMDGRDMIMMSSNNYLGLTTHPKVKAAAIKAINKYGASPSASSLLGGTIDIHIELEEALAEFKHVEAVSLFSSGYVTNVTALTTILSKGDAVFDDELNHASIIDGSRLSGAYLRAYKHRDVADLEKKLTQCQSTHRLVVTDSVFSMDGDLAPLPELFRVARRHGAALYVDEAHATGIFGQRGRGALEHFGMEGKADIVMGTLSKSLAGIGGFVGGPRELIRILKHTARAFVFSAYMPPSVCAGVLAALKLIDDEPERRQQLWRNANRLRNGLRNLGLRLTDSVSPIIPVIFPTEEITNLMTKELRSRGLYVSPVIFPAVKRNMTRIRLTVMATHTDRDIDRAVAEFDRAWKKIRSRVC